MARRERDRTLAGYADQSSQRFEPVVHMVRALYSWSPTADSSECGMSACQEPSNDRRKNEYHPDHVRVRNVAWKEASGTTATRAGTFNDHLLEHVGAVLD